MAVTLAILTIAVILLVQWILQLTDPERAGETQEPSVPVVTQDTRDTGSRHYHPGHTWISARNDGLVTIGANEFVSRFMGQLASIELPRVGARIQAGEPAWTLTSRRDRQLSQIAPLDGVVEEVNLELLKEPDLLSRSPYQLGWVLRIRPHGDEPGLGGFIPSSLADIWIDAIKTRVFSHMGTTMADGGEWAQDLGDQMEDATWTEIRREFFPAESLSCKPARKKPDA